MTTFAKSTGLFKKIVVSTDSYKISKIAKRYGAEVPFIRSRKLSNDFAPTKDVVLDCIKRISSENTKYHFRNKFFWVLIRSIIVGAICC